MKFFSEAHRVFHFNNSFFPFISFAALKTKTTTVEIYCSYCRTWKPYMQTKLLLLLFSSVYFSQKMITVYRAYLSIAVFLKFRIMYSILTVRQIELSHPLTGVLSSLNCEFHHPCRATKIYLIPLKTVVMPCAPGPYSCANTTQMKSTTVRSVVSVPAGRSAKLSRANAAVFHSQRLVAAWPFKKKFEDDDFNQRSSFVIDI